MTKTERAVYLLLDLIVWSWSDESRWLVQRDICYCVLFDDGCRCLWFDVHYLFYLTKMLICVLWIPAYISLLACFQAAHL